MYAICLPYIELTFSLECNFKLQIYLHKGTFSSVLLPNLHEEIVTILFLGGKTKLSDAKKLDCKKSKQGSLMR